MDQNDYTVFEYSNEYEYSTASYIFSLKYNTNDIVILGRCLSVCLSPVGVMVKVKVHTLDIAPLHSESSPQKRSGTARVLKGFHSFTCTMTNIRRQLMTELFFSTFVTLLLSVL